MPNPRFEYEAVYRGMPTVGLGQIGKIVPATGKHESARGRLEREQKESSANSDMKEALHGRPPFGRRSTRAEHGEADSGPGALHGLYNDDLHAPAARRGHNAIETQVHGHLTVDVPSVTDHEIHETYP